MNKLINYFAILFCLFFSFNIQAADHSVLNITANDFVIGDADAPVTIIEYASMSCSPSNVRYDYMNALYKLQKSWVMREHKDTRSELYKIMQSGGMQQDEFDACLSDLKMENYILEGVMNAQREFNIRSTPTFVINGIIYSGNKNIKEFRQIIDKILSQ